MCRHRIFLIKYTNLTFLTKGETIPFAHGYYFFKVKLELNMILNNARRCPANDSRTRVFQVFKVWTELVKSEQVSIGWDIDFGIWAQKVHSFIKICFNFCSYWAEKFLFGLKVLIGRVLIGQKSSYWACSYRAHPLYRRLSTIGNILLIKLVTLSGGAEEQNNKKVQIGLWFSSKNLCITQLEGSLELIKS